MNAWCLLNLHSPVRSTFDPPRVLSSIGYPKNLLGTKRLSNFAALLRCPKASGVHLRDECTTALLRRCGHRSGRGRLGRPCEDLDVSDHVPTVTSIAASVIVIIAIATA